MSSRVLCGVHTHKKVVCDDVCSVLNCLNTFLLHSLSHLSFSLTLWVTVEFFCRSFPNLLNQISHIVCVVGSHQARVYRSHEGILQFHMRGNCHLHALLCKHTCDEKAHNACLSGYISVVSVFRTNVWDCSDKSCVYACADIAAHTVWCWANFVLVATYFWCLFSEVGSPCRSWARLPLVRWLGLLAMGAQEFDIGSYQLMLLGRQCSDLNSYQLQSTLNSWFSHCSPLLMHTCIWILVSD